MLRSWKPFEGVPNGYKRQRVRISINGKGTMMLNRNAFEELGLPEFVELLHDPENKLIGIRPARALKDNVFPVRPAASNYYRISAQPFCKAFGLKFRQTTLFLNTFKNADGILELDLRRTMPVTRGA